MMIEGKGQPAAHEGPAQGPTKSSCAPTSSGIKAQTLTSPHTTQPLTRFLSVSQVHITFVNNCILL